MDQTLNIILRDTYSLTQLKHRLNVLKSYLLKALFGNQEILAPLSKEDLTWLKSLPETFYQQFNKDNVYTAFANLHMQISKLTTLTIYLAFEPDEAALTQIGSYARKSFGTTLLLDTRFDPRLTAGCALSFKGIYKDYSLRSKIEEKKAEILEGFKRYLR